MGVYILILSYCFHLCSAELLLKKLESITMIKMQVQWLCFMGKLLFLESTIGDMKLGIFMFPLHIINKLQNLRIILESNE